MKANQVMTLVVTCLTPETSLKRAQQMMARLHVRHVPVTSNGRLVGILSDRDLLRFGHVEANSTLSVPDMPVGEAMTLNPLCCPPGTKVSQLASLMIEKHIDSIPITGLGGQLAGLVTSTDLIKLLTRPDQISDELPFGFNVELAREARPAA